MAVEPTIVIGVEKLIEVIQIQYLLSVVMDLLVHLRNVGCFAILKTDLPCPLKETKDDK